jgi:Rrf2 family transcriptional regulator, cysteine metabolism repressor
MKLSVKADYACRAVEALSLHHPNDRPLTIEGIAQWGGIPASYLVQILIELKGKGLIRSQRGKAGGYVLAKLPKDITVGDVVRATDGELVELSVLTDSASPQEIQRIWRRIKFAAEEVADNVTFEDICAEAAIKPQMYYI